MTQPEKGYGELPEKTVKELRKLTIEELRERLKEGGNLIDCDLSGLDMEGVDFSGSDMTGVIFYNKERGDKETNLTKAIFTDVRFANTGIVSFEHIRAEEATFQFSETLDEKRQKLAELLEENPKYVPDARETGALSNINFHGANLKKSQFINVDFMGSCYPVLFFKTDLSEVKMTGCDLSNIDLSGNKIDGIKIKNCLLNGLVIEADQVDIIFNAIEDEGQTLKDYAEEQGLSMEEALTTVCGINII